MSEFDDRDEPASSRTNTVAIVLAVVFLTVLGAGVGILLGLGTDGKGTGTNVANQSTGPSPAPPAPDGNGASAEPNGGNNGTRTRTASPSAGKSYPPTRKDACPKQSEEAAGTSLTVVLYIRTARSEAWICQGQGRTYYQGHVRGRPFPAAKSDYSIFLTDVHYEAGVYAASNNETVYFVSTERLRIVRDTQETSNEPVEEYYGG
jgi:hypothetical protein